MSSSAPDKARRMEQWRASRHLNMERMDTQVGPIRVEVIEPLQKLLLRRAIHNFNFDHSACRPL